MATHHLLKFLALAAAAFLLMAPTSVSALSMGTLQKEQSASANAGDLVKFTLLFWNIENEPYTVELSTLSAPDDWTVVASPREFNLGPEVEGKIEYIYLPYLKKSIGAKAVEIYIRIPESASSGKHDVAVKAVAKNPQDGFVNVIGQRRFSFEIYVDGETKESAGTEGGTEKEHMVIIENQNPRTIPETEIVPEKSESKENSRNKIWIYSAAMFMLIIAWVIYRHE